MRFEEGEFGIFPAQLVKGLAPNLQVVLSWLIFHTNNKTGVAFPSHSTLCKETGIKSRTTMIQILNDLETAGYIRKKNRSRENGGNTSNEYEVFIKRSRDCTFTEQPIVQELDTNQKKDNQKNPISEMLFKECWRVYGCKGNKRIAKKYWDKLSEEDRANIRKCITVYIGVREYQFRKDFQGYINPQYRRWEENVSENNGVVRI